MITPSQFIKDWVINKEWWFASSKYIDAFITLEYQHLLDIDLTNEDSITKIIIYDQLPRHIFRNEDSNHIISYYLQKSLNVLNYTNQEYINGLSSILWCFSMLPYRHTNNLNKITDVMKKIWNKLDKNEQDKHIIKKFLKATYQRCPIDDQSLMIQYYPNDMNDLPTKYLRIDDIKKDFKDILDLNTYECECQVDNKIFRNIKINSNEDKNIILSLSGGVDSIICSAMLVTKYESVVHINYCNRPTSDREEEFVKAWCDFLRKPLYVRRINEITRQPCMENDLRELYETYTRKVRYATYKTVNSYGNIKNNNTQVILGHNKDDCLENIFTNIAHENHYENLKGMNEYSIQDGIEFIRPLLNITKNEIRTFAFKMNYMFLPNSTPIWSQRGQIRQNIVPVLEKWDNRIIEGLFNITNTITDLHEILDSFVTSYIIKTIFYQETNMYVLHSNIIPELPLFWKTYIIKLCKSIPSNKSMNNLIFKLKNWNKYDDITVIISKNVTLHFSKDKCEINFIEI
jgi:tRNA(Ile)-lysidine synthetase-like protein